MKILGVIPARYASTRFPGKPLAIINGKSMIQRVYEQASKALTLKWVVVATDDKRIFDHVKNFGGTVIMTSSKHPNGTLRVSEAVNKLTSKPENLEIDAVINIQGDEPFIKPEQIDVLANTFNDNNTEIATLCKKIEDYETLFNPNVVKVIKNKNDFAIYFSRSAIPYAREYKNQEWQKKISYFKHLGIYGYRTEILKKIVTLKPTPLETAEKLEQLRWLENGFKIKVVETNFETLSVDTPDDLEKIKNKNR